MPNPTKIRATAQDGIVDVKVLMSHIMETGEREDENGEIIPAHFIKEVTASHDDKTVLSAQFGTGISRNPYLEFKFEGGKKGDKVTITWVDNKGGEQTDEEVIR